MTFYFGKPAQGLIALPNPARSITPTNERQAVIHVSSSGARQVDLASRARRTFALSWQWLDPVTFSILEQFFTGARGPGPFVLLDPGRRNHLSANQSGATSQTNDPTGFTVAAGSGEGLASATGPVARGPRSLRWMLPANVSSGVLDLDPPPGLPGVPTAGQSWTFSGQVSAPGVSGVTVTPALSWRRADGTEAAVTLGSPVAAAAGFLPFSVTGSPAGGAPFVRAQLRVAPGSLFTVGGGNDPNDVLVAGVGRRSAPALTTPILLATGQQNRPLVAAHQPAWWGTSGFIATEQTPIVTTDLIVDQPMLDLSTSVRPWTLGTGVPQVSITAFPETYQILPDRHLSMTLVEVA